MAEFAHSGSQPGAQAGPLKNSWYPYVDNGGTVLAVAGDDFCVVAGDTRLSLGYSIQCRECPKVFQLTDKCCIATSGMQSDALTLHKFLRFRLRTYEHKHGKQMSTPSIAQMLANTLYYRRFFPYYTFNVLGGIDEKGEGVVYSYDAIGSFERLKYSSSGSGSALVEAFLDNQVAYKNRAIVPSGKRSLEDTLELVKDTFSSSGERDIYTGDSVQMYVISAAGVRMETFPLKKD